MYFMFNNFFFRKSCRVWNNVAKHGTARQDTDYNIIRRMRFTCWIIKATDTHSEYLILACISLPRQQWLRESVSMLRLYVPCLVNFITFTSLLPTVIRKSKNVEQSNVRAHKLRTFSNMQFLHQHAERVTRLPFHGGSYPEYGLRRFKSLEANDMQSPASASPNVSINYA
jgi:hypothetical protein